MSVAVLEVNWLQARTDDKTAKEFETLTVILVNAILNNALDQITVADVARKAWEDRLIDAFVDHKVKTSLAEGEILVDYSWFERLLGSHTGVIL